MTTVGNSYVMFGGIDIPQESKKEQQKADANDDVYIIRIGLSKFQPLSRFYTILIFASKIQIFSPITIRKSSIRF